MGERAERRRKRQRLEASLLLLHVKETPVSVVCAGLADWAEGPVLLERFGQDSRFFGIDPIQRYVDSTSASKFPGSITTGMLWDVDGQRRLLGDRRSSTSVFCLESRKGADPISANTYTLDSMVYKNWRGFPAGPSLLWIDIEGAELHAFKGAVKYLKEYCKWIVCEHREKSPFPGWATSNDIIPFLEDMGFDLVQQIKMDGMFVKR